MKKSFLDKKPESFWQEWNRKIFRDNPWLNKNKTVKTSMKNEGIVKFFNDQKGFGFIIDKSSQEEIFVHASGIEGRELKKGDRVKFNLSEGKKGAIATEVEVVG